MKEYKKHNLDLLVTDIATSLKKKSVMNDNIAIHTATSAKASEKT